MSFCSTRYLERNFPLLDTVSRMHVQLQEQGSRRRGRSGRSGRSSRSSRSSRFDRSGGTGRPSRSWTPGGLSYSKHPRGSTGGSRSQRAHHAPHRPRPAEAGSREEDDGAAAEEDGGAEEDVTEEDVAEEDGKGHSSRVDDTGERGVAMERLVRPQQRGTSSDKSTHMIGPSQRLISCRHDQLRHLL